MSYYLDANVLIAAWYQSYVPEVFPSLWEELVVEKDLLILIQPIFDEIEPISDSKFEALTKKEIDEKYAVRSWIINNDIGVLPIDDKIEGQLLSLEKKYEIGPKTKGASKTDMTLIAYAKKYKHSVVTFEKIQPPDPNRKKSNYKIPLICSEEKVKCITFVQMIQALKISI